MNQTKEISKSTGKILSEKERGEIFNEFLEVFVINQSKKAEREKSVLIEKIKILTKGKEIVVDNRSF